MTAHRRSLPLTAELLRGYSRRGNFHSDPEEARRLGMQGLVAQGMQVAGPAYGALLDEWGDEFLARGELELRFVGMARDGDTVDAEVIIDGSSAEIEVRNGERTAVVGRASVVARPE